MSNLFRSLIDSYLIACDLSKLAWYLSSFSFLFSLMIALLVISSSVINFLLFLKLWKFIAFLRLAFVFSFSKILNPFVSLPLEWCFSSVNDYIIDFKFFELGICVNLVIASLSLFYKNVSNSGKNYSPT